MQRDDRLTMSCLDKTEPLAKRMMKMFCKGSVWYLQHGVIDPDLVRQPNPDSSIARKLALRNSQNCCKARSQESCYAQGQESGTMLH